MAPLFLPGVYDFEMAFTYAAPASRFRTGHLTVTGPLTEEQIRAHLLAECARDLPGVAVTVTRFTLTPRA
ncbi:hypothetical protein ACFU99_34950 [Streptomyces sp. NPDC057654]|uniref:hypothetical protein n=1 Tax=Streptomyces sp. NPDC057654 TaxID=3346196 RepID=UPI0036914372